MWPVNAVVNNLNGPWFFMCFCTVQNLYLLRSMPSFHQWELMWIQHPGLRPNPRAGSRGCLDKWWQWSVGLYHSWPAEKQRWELRNFYQGVIMNHFSRNVPIPLCIGLLLRSRTSFNYSPPVNPCCKVVLVFKLHQWASLFYYLDLRLSSMGVSLSQWKHMEFNKFWQAFTWECGLPDHQQDNYTLLKINRRILPKRPSCCLIASITQFAQQ